MYKMIWPVVIVVLANTFYNICQKSTPGNINPFCALMITYIVAAVLSGIIFVTSTGLGGVAFEFHKLNWASFILGIAIVGLEVGFIFLYRAGWKVSVGPFLCNSILSIVLILVGFLYYHESISVKQLIGMLVCTGGLLLITL